MFASRFDLVLKKSRLLRAAGSLSIAIFAVVVIIMVLAIGFVFVNMYLNESRKSEMSNFCLGAVGKKLNQIVREHGQPYLRVERNKEGHVCTDIRPHMAVCVRDWDCAQAVYYTNNAASCFLCLQTSADGNELVSEAKMVFDDD